MEKAEEYIPKSYAGKRNRVTVDTGTETRVEQHHRETTDINKIIGRYRQSGQLPPNTRELQYMDVSQVGELMDVKLAMSEAQEIYESLPNNIKEKLPFADIGNVTNESLQEMINELQNKARQPSEEEVQTSDEIKKSEKSAGTGADAATRNNVSDGSEEDK